MMNKKKWIKFLVYGMIGAVLTMIGDCFWEWIPGRLWGL